MAKGIWKFTEARWGAGMADHGIFMISSLDYFAYLETVLGFAGIGDARETGAQHAFEGPVNVKDLEPGSLGPFVVWDPDADTVIQNVVFAQNTGPAHVFCVTEGDFDEQAAVFCTADTGYDAALEIVDLDGLATAFLKEGRIVEDGDAAAGAYFSGASVNPVIYGPRTVDMRDPLTQLNKGPFGKEVTFAAQRERRIVLEDHGPPVHDNILIQIPDPDRFVRRVAFDRTWPNRRTEMKSDLRAEVLDLRSQLKAARSDGPPFPNVDRVLAGRTPAAARIHHAAELDEAYAKDVQDHDKAHEEWMSKFADRVLSVLWRLRIEHGLRGRLNSPYDIRGNGELRLHALIEALEVGQIDGDTAIVMRGTPLKRVDRGLKMFRDEA